MASARKRAKRDTDNYHNTAENKEHQKLVDLCKKVKDDLDLVDQKIKADCLKVDEKYQKLKEPFSVELRNMVANIPQFWLTAFGNHPNMKSSLARLSDEEKEVMKFLNAVEIQSNTGPNESYTIHFHFDDNPYLENECVSKNFSLDENGEVSACPLAAPLSWKSGMEPPKLPRPARGRNPCQFEVGHQEDFFSWLSNARDDMYELGLILKEDICEHPLRFYLNQGIDETNYITIEENELDEENEDGNEEDDEDEGDYEYDDEMENEGHAHPDDG